MSAADKIAEVLLPCPFCGAKPHRNLGKVWHCQIHGDRNQDHIIKCPHLCVTMTGSEEGVRERWNQRADLADAQAQEIARLTEALGRIVEWSEAYPLDVFQEPDFEKVRSVLEASGMTLDAVSASNMRHVLKGAGAIARAALGETP